MTEKYIFNIPVYVCSNEEYDRKREAYFKKQLEVYSVGNDNYSIENFEHIFYKHLWRPWKYNQVIGFIEIFIFGKDIRGEFYFEKSKRISIRSKKRRYELNGKAFEMGVYFAKQTDTIFETLSTKLENLKNEKPFKGRFIDLSEFYEIGPFINWKVLLGY